MASATYDRKTDPRLKEAGKRGAERRWGPAGTQVIKIGDLTVEQRHLVIALVDAARSATEGKAAPEVAPGAAASGGHPHADPTD